jgi:AraC-like DNA-binding protein
MIAEVHRWSTAQADPGEAFGQWTIEACTHIADLAFSSSARDGFEARFIQRQLGPIGMTAIQASQSQALRDMSRHRPAAERFDFKYIRQGVFRVEQDGRVVEAAAGEFVLVDNNDDFRFATSDDIDCVCLTLPEAWLKAHVLDEEACLVRPVAGESAWGRSLGLMLSELADLPQGDSPLPGSVLADQVGGFLTLLFDSAGHGETPPQRHVARKILRTIRARHYQPDLAPGGVAALHSISKRHLHALLAAAGTTFGRELLRERLAHAAVLLRETSQDRLAVGEIGRRCGFTDPAHFSRRFRQAYGQSPNQFRKSAA